MADIPIIPGVSVATKGILNKPLKDIICALLFGGLNNMLKGPLLCVNIDLDKLIQDQFPGVPSLADLAAELKNVRDQLKAAEALCGIPETLARVNAAIAEVQSLLALDGLCAIPLRAPKIPDVIAQVIDAEFNEMNAILNDLGRLSKPQVCLNGDGGINTGTYNPSSILGSIQHHINRMEDIPGNVLAQLKTKLQGVSLALDKSINRQLFPDFRHKHDLTTGKPYVAGGGPTLAGLPAVQWNPPYPPADAPNLKSATATAQMLVASMSKTASYPVDVNGIRNENIWLAMLGPEVYAMAIGAMTPVDPLFTQQDPIYDYCGKLVGYTSTVITGDITAIGGNPAADAQPNPPLTNFSLNWISDRNCWGVIGVQSEQIVNGRRDVHLNANPIIAIHRGYNHTFSIPSIDISGTGAADEFFICYVDTDLTPRKDINGNVVPFNLGLARLETYELLEDANGSFDDTYALQRKASFPTGTTLYFAAENRVYSGTTAPTTPTESVWWYNTVTCLAQRWVVDAVANDGTGSWVSVTDEDRNAHWFGSSIRYDDPNVNYLAYSNKDGSAFGLLKFI